MLFRSAGEVAGLLTAYRNRTGTSAGLEDMVLSYMSSTEQPEGSR